MNRTLKILFLIIADILILNNKNIFSQSKDSLQKINSIKQTPQNNNAIPSNNQNKNIYKPEIFTSGFIDFINNGQVNASARFIRLYVGEPGNPTTGKKGFSIPLSIYSGVSSNNFQNPYAFQRSNDVLVTNFINPLSGLANISIDGVLFFNKKEKATRGGCLYHLGERILTGIRTGPVGDPATGKPINFLGNYIQLWTNSI